jgi:hypothetical protein
MLSDAKERTLKVPKTKSPLMEFIEVIYFPHWIQFRMDLVCNRKPRLTLGIPYVHTVHASVASDSTHCKPSNWVKTNQWVYALTL